MFIFGSKFHGSQTLLFSSPLSLLSVFLDSLVRVSLS